MVCLGKWFHDTAGDDRLSTVRIHVSEILAYRNIKKHHGGGYRREQKEEVRDDVLTLHSIWVKSNQLVYEAAGKKRRQKAVSVKSHLLDVAVESDRDLFGEETPYAFRIRPGEARPYLGELTRMTALLLRPVLGYDCRQGVGRMAMRLGLYLTMQWRIRAAHGTLLQPWAVRTLLEGARIPLPTDARVFGRFRDQAEQAFDRLHADGVIAGWHYDRGDEAALPKRGAFDHWLKWTVAVVPPREIPERYQALPGERRRAMRAAQAGAAASRRRGQAATQETPAAP